MKNDELLQKTKMQEDLMRYYFMIDNMHETIWEMDLDLVFSFISPGVKNITGHEASEVIGKSLYDFLSPDSCKYIKHVQDSFKSKYRPGVVTPSITHEIELLCKDGGTVWTEIKTNLKEVQNQPVGYVGYTLDISERKKSEQKLKEYIDKLETMATTDLLTGVYNRRKLDDMMEFAIETARRNDRPFSLIMFDIDHFKKVNDQLGHKVGDDVLIKLSNLVYEKIRKTDCMVRWGGEEFIILLFETDITEADATAEKIRELVENYDFGIDRNVSISLGVTQFCGEESIEQLIIRLDKALLRAKNEGRNRCVSLDCLGRKVLEKQQA